MNGKLNLAFVTHRAGTELTARLNQLIVDRDGNVAGVNVVDIIKGYAAELEQRANANLDTVAYDVVAADAENVQGIGELHKIQNIKTVRELTGVGLREAKEAVERAVPRVFKDRAVNALDMLAAANKTAHWSHGAYINPDNHSYALAYALATR